MMLFRSKNAVCLGTGLLIGTSLFVILKHCDPNNSDLSIAFKLGVSLLAALGGGITPRINEFFPVPEINDFRSMN